MTDQTVTYTLNADDLSKLQWAAKLAREAAHMWLLAPTGDAPSSSFAEEVIGLIDWCAAIERDVTEQLRGLRYADPLADIRKRRSERMPSYSDLRIQRDTADAWDAGWRAGAAGMTDPMRITVGLPEPEGNPYRQASSNNKE